MTRLRLSRAGSSTNLFLVAIVVLALAVSGSIAYATSASGDSDSGKIALIWTSCGGGCPPSATHSVGYVSCTVSISTAALLTIGASNLGPGTNCMFSATVMNTGTLPATLDDSYELVSRCSSFQYTDNIYRDSPAPAIGGGGKFDYTSTFSLSSSAGNTCQDAVAIVEVTITGTGVTTYSVTLSENGLPAGLTWTVTLNGVRESLTTNGCTDSLTWTGLAIGTYAYSIADISGWHQTTLPYKGNVVVNGASVTEPALVYKQVTYSVTFSESGLPSGKSWSVTLDGNGVTQSSTTSTITFAEPNGTYGYTIGTVKGYTASPSSGSVTVNGASAAVSVTFKT